MSSHLCLDGEEEGPLRTGDCLIDQQQLVRLQGVVLGVVPAHHSTVGEISMGLRVLPSRT